MGRRLRFVLAWIKWGPSTCQLARQWHVDYDVMADIRGQVRNRRQYAWLWGRELG